jgi:hypothetical protein
MKRLFACLASLSLCACGTTVVPVVKEAIKCEPPAGMLAACDTPSALADGVTFGGMIDVSQRDRDALRLCGARHEDLVKALADCNARIDQHNAEIRKLNAQSTGQQ